ncbi:glutathione S-transferase-like isoform X1 [Bombus vosnesenskii]|uniref:Glutathione S-transferase-like isoform X1 n=1 Tax=Bombus vosnesenskii TaxID=207650 RepID=A0A6J3LCJ9_9HYME|nr:glutathione S-transferase-like isoform X1 [Bombus vosnesenskii]
MFCTVGITRVSSARARAGGCSNIITSMFARATRAIPLLSHNKDLLLRVIFRFGDRRSDNVCGGISIREIAAFHYEEGEKVKAAKRKAAEETLLFILERLDQQVKENDGYFYDDTLSSADLTFVALLDYLNFMCKSDLIENYENLKLLEKKVLLLPKIKNWIERRPVSEF